MRTVRWSLASALGALALGCGATAANEDSSVDAGAVVDSGSVDGVYGSDGGFLFDGGVLRADRFVTKVVSFTPGDCAGFGIPQMPSIVTGPPVGGGEDMGTTDVVSLGTDGEIVVSFEPNAIVDGPGADFIVFENPFYIGGNPNDVYAEPGEVSVSDDGTTWKTYPCTATSNPYGSCAGWHVVYSNPANGISPVDPRAAGGDAFDLADVGLTHVRFVRIRDKAHERCPGPPTRLNTNGFDLDAISIVNAEHP